jgi:hypothetical protein
MADRRAHPRNHIRADAPQEVRLVLGAVGAPVQRASLRAGVVAGGDGVAVQCPSVGEEIGELRERVAAHARYRRAAACVLAHEILDDVPAEPVLEVEDVVRDPKAIGHGARVLDRVQGAAGPIRNALFAVAEELHRGADDLVALLDQEGGGHGGIHSTGHGDEDAFSHGTSPGAGSAPWPRPARRSRPRARPGRARRADRTRSAPRSRPVHGARPWPGGRGTAPRFR